MKIHKARTIACQWVQCYEASLPGFMGACLGGSTAELAPEELITNGSDLDIYVILKGDLPPKRGKFEYEGVLLEVSYLAAEEVFATEQVQTSYHLANLLRYQQIIADPTGDLKKLAAEVAENFSKPEWIRKRCDFVINRVAEGFRGLNYDAALPDRTIAWLFSTGIMTHAVLVAALRNPTVRLRYLRAKEVLVAAGLSEVHEQLLRLSGFVDLTAVEAEELLGKMERAFDLACRLRRTDFFFATDISEVSRETSIDTIRRLNGQGFYRETAFWVYATFARAMKILQVDAPEQYEVNLEAFQWALDLVGRGSEREIRQAADRVLAWIPLLEQVTEKLICQSEEK